MTLEHIFIEIRNEINEMMNEHAWTYEVASAMVLGSYLDSKVVEAFRAIEEE
jgi:hypothetical protein